MKKLKLNKLFHWLYAFLMFLPVLLFFYFFIANFSAGVDVNNFDVSNLFAPVSHVLFEFNEGSMGESILHFFDYLVFEVVGCDTDPASYAIAFSLYLLVYWVCISLLYLVFDVLMLPINIAHHWIDKGSDRL